MSRCTMLSEWMCSKAASYLGSSVLYEAWIRIRCTVCLTTWKTVWTITLARPFAYLRCLVPEAPNSCTQNVPVNRIHKQRESRLDLAEVWVHEPRAEEWAALTVLETRDFLIAPFWQNLYQLLWTQCPIHKYRWAVGPRQTWIIGSRNHPFQSLLQYVARACILTQETLEWLRFDPHRESSRKNGGKDGKYWIFHWNVKQWVELEVPLVHDAHRERIGFKRSDVMWLLHMAWNI